MDLPPSWARRRNDIRRWSGEIFQRLDDFGGALRATRGIFFKTPENEVVERARQTGVSVLGGAGAPVAMSCMIESVLGPVKGDWPVMAS